MGETVPNVFLQIFYKIGKGERISSCFEKSANDFVIHSRRRRPWFDLLDKFQVCLTSGEKFTVVLKDCLIKSLYDDPEFYQSIGRESCVIFDNRHNVCKRRHRGHRGVIL